MGKSREAVTERLHDNAARRGTGLGRLWWSGAAFNGNGSTSHDIASNCFGRRPSCSRFGRGCRLRLAILSVLLLLGGILSGTTHGFALVSLGVFAGFESLRVASGFSP